MSAFTITDEMIAYFRSQYTPGDNDHLQIILTKLREKAFSQTQITYLLYTEASYSLPQAKSIVLNGEPDLPGELIEEHLDERK